MVDIHHCPRCDLRFRNLAELESHLYDDHDVLLPREGIATTTQPSPKPTTAEITVALDPTRAVSPALEVATTIAAQASSALELVAVTPAGLDDRSTEGFLGRVAGRHGNDDVPLSVCALGGGGPADRIVEHLDRGRSSLVCMDTRARGAAGEAILGSVSESVVRRAPVPVLLCGPHLRPEAKYRRILVAVDGSEIAERSLVAASELARSAGLEVELIEVLDPRDPVPSDVAPSAYLHRLADASPIPIDDYDTVQDRNPARAIADLAEREPGTIVAVGTHGRSGYQRLRLGSVSLDVVKRSGSPVLVVPPGAYHSGPQPA